MKVVLFCFSPTGGTMKVAGTIAYGVGDEVEVHDMVSRDFSPSSVTVDGGDVAVIAVPSFGGRVPSVAAERLSGIAGNGARAVLVCVYGNRAYEDTLAELQDIAEADGFNVVAAIEAVAEHSIARQYATGRPDAEDNEVLKGFAARIKAALDAGSERTPAIPGDRPYRKAGGVSMVPKPTKDCVRCGLCARECPVAAIDSADPKKVDGGLCFSCMRCVSVCPHGARRIGGMMASMAGMALKKSCAERKEPRLFMED